MSGSKIYGTFTQWNTTQQKKEGAPTFHDSMDGTGEHYAKENKPDGVGQIQYDVTFNWKIINRKKSKQIIIGDIEVKNNLTMGRGEWGGDSEERGLQELL